jgi:hypothetical protein
MFLPRPVQIIGGVFLTLVSLLCLWGSLAILELPPKPSPLFFYAMDFTLFAGSVWVFAKGVRLVIGHPVHGGLMGPTALQLAAWLFLLIPIGAILAGTFWEGQVVFRIVQALSYVGIFIVLRRVAAQRKIRFLWSDAWLLDAIARASKTHPASLADIIAAADMIQHALPTADELHGALLRLTAAGYIIEIDQRFLLTSDVPKVADYRVFLDAESWTSESNVGDPRNAVTYPGLTAERIEAAERDYRARSAETE